MKAEGSKAGGLKRGSYEEAGYRKRLIRHTEQRHRSHLHAPTFTMYDDIAPHLYDRGPMTARSRPEGLARGHHYKYAARDATIIRRGDTRKVIAITEQTLTSTPSRGQPNGRKRESKDNPRTLCVVPAGSHRRPHDASMDRSEHIVSLPEGYATKKS